MRLNTSISISAFFFLATCFLFVACEKEPCIPANYEFENVNYEGQTLRLDMAQQMKYFIDSAFSDQNGNSSDQILQLINMYQNVQNPFANLRLDTCGKEIKDKTILSEQSRLEDYIQSISDLLDHKTRSAQNGLSGVKYANNGTPYFLDSNGMEIKQVIEKGIMGACFYYQATAVYLGAGKMDVDNQVVTAGKGTDMEHHWDESFGYLAAPVDFSATSTGLRFWAKYANVVSQTYTPLRDQIMKYYIEGRVAIGQNDLDKRDQAIYEIRKNWEILLVGTAIHYLNAAIQSSASNDLGKYYHQISEAFMFIHSLQFGARVSGMSNTMIQDYLTNAFGASSPLQVNLYQCTVNELEQLKTNLTDQITELQPYKDQL